MKSANRRIKASKYRYRGLFKKLGLILLSCLVLKLTLRLGGEKAVLSWMQSAADNQNFTASILQSELSYPQNTSTPEEILRLESSILSYEQKDTPDSPRIEEENAPKPSLSENPNDSTLPQEAETDPVPSEPPIDPLPIGDLSAVSLSDYLDSSDIKNRTSYEIDPTSIVREPLGFTIDPTKPQILIIHTHGSEAYTPDGENTYTESDPMRTQNCEQNVVRVGSELQDALESYGILSIHDTELYDYPSYNGSYTRSYEAIQGYLKQYPDIRMVIDLHRDAVDTSGETPYVTTAEVDGKTASQVLLLVGTDYSGLEHPDWRKNLRLALYLQAAMNYEYPGLARPVKISEYRYNQQATHGSMILEVGYCTNTLEESITAVKAFAKSAADILMTYAVE